MYFSYYCMLYLIPNPKPFQSNWLIFIHSGIRWICVFHRPSSRYIPHRSSYHINSGGRCLVFHYLLWMHWSTARKHSPSSNSENLFKLLDKDCVLDCVWDLCDSCLSSSSVFFQPHSGLPHPTDNSNTGFLLLWPGERIFLFAYMIFWHFKIPYLINIP